MGPGNAKNTRYVSLDDLDFGASTILIDRLKQKIEESSEDPELAQKIRDNTEIRNAIVRGADLESIWVETEKGEAYRIETVKDESGKLFLAIRNRTPEREEYKSALAQFERDQFLARNLPKVYHTLGQIFFGGNCMLQTILFNAQSGVTNLSEGESSDISLVIEDLKRGQGIMSNLLEMKKGENTNKYPVNVNDSLEKVVYVMNNLYSGIIFEADYASGLPPITGNGYVLTDIWRNIIENSCQALHEDRNRDGRGEKKIVIETGRRFNERIGEDMVRVSIRDNGPGMDEKAYALWKADIGNETPYTTKESGNGIGRIIVNEALKFHEAGFNVKTVAGRGTKFSIYFPKAKAQNLSEYRS